MKVWIILGTRPEAIKLWPLIRGMSKDRKFSPIVVSTNQQKDLTKDIERVLGMPPDFMPSYALHGDAVSSFVANSISYLQEVFVNSRPDLILVHGDTSTAFAGALTGFLNGIPVGHVEAGLRTYDLEAPFPEEGYRQMISRIVDFHFAPTKLARENLEKEGIQNEKIIVCGNTVVDAVDALREDLVAARERVLQGLGLKVGSVYCVVTLHRRENHGDRILKALRIVEREFSSSDAFVVVVKHPNPKVLETISALSHLSSNLIFIDPLPYEDFLSLVAGSSLLITDSGGLQEEAVSLGVRALVVRDKTERPEGIDSGLIRLVGNDSGDLAESIRASMSTREQRETSVESMLNPYGDGLASSRILEFISTRGQALPGHGHLSE